LLLPNKKKKMKNTKQKLMMVLIILLVIGAGMFAVQQTLGYYYKSKFLQTPCELCLSLNSNLSLCPKEKYSPYMIDIGNLTISPELQ